jgi:hypothetical protein
MQAAKASRLFSDQVTASKRQVIAFAGSVEWIDVPITVNQGLKMLRRAQSANSGHVFVRICCSVFAVKTTLAS